MGERKVEVEDGGIEREKEATGRERDGWAIVRRNNVARLMVMPSADADE